jgi:uroporphyrinogen-III decarboxylase
LSEPISDNKAPLISPAMFEEFVISTYEKIIGVAKAKGCEHILVCTYGNTARLFPSMIKAGVSMLWISEAAEIPELDYRSLRQKWASPLGLIGGIPLSILRSSSPEEMKDRLREIVIPLMESGRFIPLAGGRVREDIPWSAYKCYRKLLAEIIEPGMTCAYDLSG